MDDLVVVSHPISIPAEAEVPEWHGHGHGHGYWTDFSDLLLDTYLDGPSRIIDRYMHLDTSSRVADRYYQMRFSAKGVVCDF